MTTVNVARRVLFCWLFFLLLTEREYKVVERLFSFISLKRMPLCCPRGELDGDVISLGIISLTFFLLHNKILSNSTSSTLTDSLEKRLHKSLNLRSPFCAEDHEYWMEASETPPSKHFANIKENAGWCLCAAMLQYLQSHPQQAASLNWMLLPRFFFFVLFPFNSLILTLSRKHNVLRVPRPAPPRFVTAHAIVTHTCHGLEAHPHRLKLAVYARWTGGNPQSQNL